MSEPQFEESLRPLLVPLEAVSIDPVNARAHSDENIELLKGSLRRYGQQRPILVDEHDVILAGNGVYLAAKALGWPQIAVIRTSLEGVDRTAYAIADNQLGATSEWDPAILAKQIQVLEGAGFPIPELGFVDAALTAILESELAPDPTEPAPVPEPPDEATTRRGDVWVLGDHRLMCGDAGVEADVDRLTQGKEMHLVHTDPPYNVCVEPRSNTAIAAGQSSFPPTKVAHHQRFDVARGVVHPENARAKMRPRDRTLEDDWLSDEEFSVLLRAWFGQAARVLAPGRSFYIWGGYANLGNYPLALADCDLYFSQAIVWDKQHLVLTRKDFMGAFEICFYGWRKGADHKFLGPPNVPDLWHVKKVSPQKMIHLTEKPVELAMHAIRYSSRVSENVLDLFGGSGSTLMACIQTSRLAYLMEIDPLYCDVIVQRWEAETGGKAKRQPAPAEAPAEAGA